MAGLLSCHKDECGPVRATYIYTTQNPVRTVISSWVTDYCTCRDSQIVILNEYIEELNDPLTEPGRKTFLENFPPKFTCE